MLRHQNRESLQNRPLRTPGNAVTLFRHMVMMLLDTVWRDEAGILRNGLLSEFHGMVKKALLQ